jgi:3',5'-cyclic AMP phosphodiesterase CpdA
MAEARSIISELKVKNIKFMPGEHDAGLDNGEAFQEFFGATHYTFDHKGVHFIVVDNVSDPTSSITDPQLQWLSAELKKLDKDSRIVVFTHRPLFDLYPQWDWWTRDGAKALDLLMPYKNVTVFYGHIHQENHHMTGHIPHHAAKGLMFPLPAPGSVPKRVPIPWDAAEPYKGLGYRSVEAKAETAEYTITEYPVKKG